MVCVAISAVADTDYRCLNNCAAGEKSSGDCIKSCTYNNHATPDKKKTAKNPHNQFSDQHVAKGMILDKQAAPAKVHEKDFACASACQKEGLQYALLEYIYSTFQRASCYGLR